jgi:hypothetical protein
MILLDEQVAEGVRPPWWRGRAYYDPMLCVGHFYPLPLNWLVQWARSFWFWLRRGPGSNAVDQAAARGWRDAIDSPKFVQDRHVVRRLRAWRTGVAALGESLARGELLEMLDDILGEGHD